MKTNDDRIAILFHVNSDYLYCWIGGKVFMFTKDGVCIDDPGLKLIQ